MSNITSNISRKLGNVVSSALKNQIPPTPGNNLATPAPRNINLSGSNSYSSGYGGGGGYVGPTTYSLYIPDGPGTFGNDKSKPSALGKEASDKEKADYWIEMDAWWTSETESRMSYYNEARRQLAKLEAMYPEYTKSQSQSQEILNARLAVAEAERRYNEAKAKADTINVSVGVTTSTDGDNERVEKTYTITDDSGNTVSTKYSEDNGGMSASELRAKQERDQQKALNASNARVQAEAAREVESIQAGSERDYAVGSAESALEAYMSQFNRNLEKIDTDYAADRLQGNQDLLLSSNETFNKAVQNSREASQILSQYNLGGSSLGGRLNQIAADAANQANQVSALTYNQLMREADKNYSDARTQLEDERSQQENAANQAKAKAEADYWARLAAQAGKSVEEMSQYANPEYWYGTMFDDSGKRLNSFADMNSQMMQDYAAQQAQRYQGHMNDYRSQQQQAADRQTSTKADQYISDYTVPAAKTYETGLKAYKPVNSNKTVLGETDITQPKLEREDEDEL